jgi:hypothetical protein
MKIRIPFMAFCIAIVCSNTVYSMDMINAIDDEFFVKSGEDELYVRVRGQHF